jgi:hypothetical protein
VQVPPFGPQLQLELLQQCQAIQRRDAAVIEQDVTQVQGLEKQERAP